MVGNDYLFRHVEVELFQATLIVVSGEIERQMRVGIHETLDKASSSPRSITRASRGIEQIDARINNLVALYDNHAVLDQGVRFAIEHPRSLQCD